MLLSAIIAVSLTSYIRLGRTALNLSSRSFYNNAAMNLAETGLEQAMWSINTMALDGLGASSPGWASSGYGWYKLDYTVFAADPSNPWKGHKWAYKYLNFFQLGQNTSGGVFVMVKDWDAKVAAPAITSWAFIYPSGAVDGLSSGKWWPPWSGGSDQISKWVRVVLYKRSKFANGLVAKQTINFKGTNPTVDSWNSDPDNDASTAAVPYPTDPVGTTPWNEAAHDLGTVGSIAVTVNSVAVQNANIYGYVATGGSAPTIGSQGVIGPFGTADGTIDPTHVSTDFTANFDPVTAPSATYTNAGALSSNKTFPDDYPAATLQGGKYYIECSSMGGSNSVYTIAAGKTVVVKCTGDVNVLGGSGAIQINTGGTLELYGAGDIKIAGKGVSNGIDANANGTIEASEMGQPAQCQIYGTKTASLSTIQIAGNGALSACVYAPMGSVTINGNGDVAGSVVANDITVVGNAAFHYDESLGNLVTGNPYGISKWDELTTAGSRTIWW